MCNLLLHNLYPATHNSFESPVPSCEILLEWGMPRMCDSLNVICKRQENAQPSTLGQPRNQNVIEKAEFASGLRSYITVAAQLIE
jgi:hypothetical protein